MNLELWQAVLLALITLAGSLGVARVSGRSSVKVKQLDVDGQAYVRAQGINAEIVEALRQQVKDIEEDRKEDRASREADKLEYQSELAKRDDRLDSIEKRLREVSRHNDALTTFIHILVAILRRHGLMDEINPQDVPDGIRV